MEFTSAMLISLLSLTAIEIVLGIDNIVFISIISGKLPNNQQEKAQKLGILLALVFRMALLFAISWIMGLGETLFTIFGEGISGRDIILLIGGLFLLGKATHEIFDLVEIDDEHSEKASAASSFAKALAQIVMLDIVFSLDSVITAVGMADHISIMIIAMVIAVAVMLAFASKISAFIQKHPSLKVLALSFLLMVGVMLMADAFDQHIPRGYIYFAMAFSLGVEMINLRVRKIRALS